MPSLAFRKASICSRFSFSASCTLVVNPQHATRSRLILCWKLSSPSGSSLVYWTRLALCAKSQTQYNGQRFLGVLRLGGKGRGSELLPGQRGFCGEKCKMCPPDWCESDAARVRLLGFYVQMESLR